MSAPTPNYYQYQVRLTCGCTIRWASNIRLDYPALDNAVRSMAAETGGMLPCVVHRKWVQPLPAIVAWATYDEEGKP